MGHTQRTHIEDVMNLFVCSASIKEHTPMNDYEKLADWRQSEKYISDHFHV